MKVEGGELLAGEEDDHDLENDHGVALSSYEYDQVILEYGPALSDLTGAHHQSVDSVLRILMYLSAYLNTLGTLD